MNPNQDLPFAIISFTVIAWRVYGKLGKLFRLEPMQFSLSNLINHPDGSMSIFITQGSGGWSIPVMRTPDGNFDCGLPQCVHKKETSNCEHVRFVREQYENVIGPSEERKAERERQAALAKLEEARAVVERLEQKVRQETVPALGGPRRIVLE